MPERCPLEPPGPNVRVVYETILMGAQGTRLSHRAGSVLHASRASTLGVENRPFAAYGWDIPVKARSVSPRLAKDLLENVIDGCVNAMVRDLSSLAVSASNIIASCAVIRRRWEAIYERPAALCEAVLPPFLTVAKNSSMPSSLRKAPKIEQGWAPKAAVATAPTRSDSRPVARPLDRSTLDRSLVLI